MRLIVANWKMNLDLNSASSLVSDFVKFMDATALQSSNINVVVCPSFVMLDRISSLLKGVSFSIKLGAQDCANQEVGAYTGDVSAEMLRSCSCEYVVLGHSERRKYHQEHSIAVKQKALIADKYGIIPIICVGESLDDHESGKTLEILESQIIDSVPDSLRRIIIAYEPVWAIGSGLLPSAKDIVAIVEFINNLLVEKIPFEESPIILYGGSVNSVNARDILELKHISGLLVGGASLKYEEFTEIITSAQNVK